MDAPVNGLNLYYEIHRQALALRKDGRRSGGADPIFGDRKTATAGYSLSANVALRIAIQRPDAVNRLALISIPRHRNGWYPEVLAGMAEATKQSAIYKIYAQGAAAGGLAGAAAEEQRNAGQGL
jgi:pimeloyl-ACP methyl ester carboxylesterase